MLFIPKDTVAAIAKEAAMLEPVEQQILLTKLRVKRLKKKGAFKVSRRPAGIKNPSLRQIDKWKHESKGKA